MRWLVSVVVVSALLVCSAAIGKVGDLVIGSGRVMRGRVLSYSYNSDSGELSIVVDRRTIHRCLVYGCQQRYDGAVVREVYSATLLRTEVATITEPQQERIEFE